MAAPDPVVVITDPRLRGIPPTVRLRPWLYLGKDIRRRAGVAQRLPGPRHALGSRLHDAAAALRRPFLDFVAGVGALQDDPLTWWSTAFSWRAWAASDLFLLICYLRVARQMIAEVRAARSPLLLVIEDPWLLRELADAFEGDGSVIIAARPRLLRAMAAAVGLGGVKRIRWLVLTAVRYGRQRIVSWKRPPRVPDLPAVAMYSVPLARCLRADGGWADPFLPGLEEYLTGMGYDVIRFSPPEAGGFERPLASRHDRFHPLMLYAGGRVVATAALTIWRPRWPRELVLEEMAVRWLARREWWVEVGRAAGPMYRLYYECLRGMLARGTWRWVVYPYENQPWEKLTALCAREFGVRTVGVQHSALSIYYLSYFLGAGEAARMPLPDAIWTAGPYSHRLLAEGGVPARRIHQCGSIRYRSPAAGSLRTGTAVDPPPRPDVLVTLPIDRPMAAHLLAALQAAFPDGGRADGLRFHIKAHPMTPITAADVGFPARWAPDNFGEALRRCSLVVFTGTTAGPEAAALGRPAVRYRPELLLDVDPSEALGDRIPTATDKDLREVLLALVLKSPAALETDDVMGNVNALFAPLDWDCVRDIFQTAGVLRPA